MARVLFTDAWTELGGGQRLLIDLVRHLSDTHECAVAFPTDGAVPELFRSEGVQTFAYDLPALAAGSKTAGEKARFVLGARAAATSLARVADEFGAEVFFCNGGRPALPTVLAAQRRGLRSLCFVQLIYGGGERRLLKWCFGRPAVGAVTFCSDAAAAPFQPLPPKASVVANWVSPTFLEPPRPRRRGDDVRVGVLGRISPTKGQRFFLEALLPLLAADARVRLAIGGGSEFEDASEEVELRALARTAADPERIELHGVVDALDFLDGLDVLVVPSLWEEPFGLVAVEGMARGLPVVATRSGALPEIVADCETGLVVEREPAALRDAVGHLVASPELRRSFGDAGRARVERSFHPARQLRVVTDLLERVLDGAPSVSPGRHADATTPTA